MDRQRHWIKRGEGGDCVFITTTGKSQEWRWLRRFARVSTNHIHVLFRLPEGLDQRMFMERFKPAASAAVKPLTSAEVAADKDAKGRQSGVL